jgi:hypothetical protein
MYSTVGIWAKSVNDDKNPQRLLLYVLKTQEILKTQQHLSCRKQYFQKNFLGPFSSEKS